MKQLIAELGALSNPAKVAIYKNFHKTDEGGYAKGEEFLGLTVPQLRAISKKYGHLTFEEIKRLLGSRVHEEKYIATLILVHKYESSEDKEKIFDFCLKNAKEFTGWDLVDTIAPSVFGDFLLDKDKSVLVKLAKSENLWVRRIAIVSTYEFIRNNSFENTLKITDLLLKDDHDLIHKACGWMLREVGKRNLEVLKTYLIERYKVMPRTMLRYAIERFPEVERKKYLRGEI